MSFLSVTLSAMTVLVLLAEHAYLKPMATGCEWQGTQYPIGAIVSQDSCSGIECTSSGLQAWDKPCITRDAV